MRYVDSSERGIDYVYEATVEAIIVNLFNRVLIQEIYGCALIMHRRGIHL